MNDELTILNAIFTLARKAEQHSPFSCGYRAVLNQCAEMLAQSGIRPLLSQSGLSLITPEDLERELACFPALHPKMRRLGNDLLALIRRDEHLRHFAWLPAAQV